MATIGGPNTEKDNLVFGYDTGYGVADNNTSTRFYPGEPTTNQADTDAKRNWGTHNGATSSTTTAPEKGPGWKKLIITNINGNNYRLAQFPYLAHANGTTRTYSVEFDVGSLTGYFMFVDGTSGYAQTNVSGKGRYSTTITASGGNKSIAIFLGKSGTHSSINHVIYYKEYQVEEKPHASLFTDSTRSDTASLIDLKRTTDIDVSNISFDSTGQPDFDGTDDRIVASPSNIVLGTSLTMEVWIYPTGYNHSRMYLMDPRGDGNTSGTNAYFLFDYHASPDTVHVVAGNSNIEVQSSNFSMPLNNWHNIVATRNGNSWVIYHNGVSVGTGTTNTTSLTLNNDFRIGTYASGTSGQYFFEGLMAVAKFYNTGLSAVEIKQNYNAYKNRFDI